jgi:hypothetical protein
VTYAGLSLMAEQYLDRLSMAVFRSRPGVAEGPPALSVTPSMIGCQRVLEHLWYELHSGEPSPKERAAQRRARAAAVTAALAAPLESAPRETHASAILGTVGFHRLAKSLAHIRAGTSPA